ncbi:MAG: pilus assembly protein PilM [Planctomycetota bacterium]|nr:pilus assembly protein PilM [Planctomycetota bacterium]
MIRQLLQGGSYPIGVDLSAAGVKLIQLRKAGAGFAVVAAARADFDDETAHLPFSERLEKITETLQRRVEGARFTTRKCVVGVEDALLRARSMRLPRMSRSEADRALRLEAPERLGFSESTPGEIGWLRAGEVRQGDDLRDELIVVGALQSDMERLVDAVAAAGLRPVAVEPAFLACGRCYSRTYRRESDDGAVRLIIDIGFDRSGIIVLRGSDVVFFKSYESGGDALNRIAAQQLGMEVGTVAELRRRGASDEQNNEGRDARVDRAIFEAIRPLLGEIVDEAARCLRYYSVTFRGERPDYVLLTGAEAHEPGLSTLARDALNVPVRVGKPLEGIDLATAKGTLERRGEQADWSAAVGLSLRGDPNMVQAAREARIGRRREDAAAARSAAQSAPRSRREAA